MIPLSLSLSSLPPGLAMARAAGWRLAGGRLLRQKMLFSFFQTSAAMMPKGRQGQEREREKEAALLDMSLLDKEKGERGGPRQTEYI